MIAAEINVVRAVPQLLHHADKFVGLAVALIVLDGCLAEAPVFAMTMPGHQVQPPAALADVIQGGAELGQVQRVPGAVEHMQGGDQQNPLGHRRQRRLGDKGIQRLVVVTDIAPVAALAQPFGEGKHQVKAQRFGAQGQLAVVVEGPGGAAWQRRRAPAAGLYGQEQAQKQRLFKGTGQRAFRKIQRGGLT